MRFVVDGYPPMCDWDREVTARDTRDIVAAARSSDAAFQQAAIGMALTAFEGRFLAVNPVFCQLVGRPEDELLGAGWQDVTYADDVEPGLREVHRMLTGAERTFQLLKRYVRPDGELVWGLLHVSLIRSDAGEPMCFLTQVVDVTAQRRTQEELSRLASIVEWSDDPILSQDLNGNIISWNRAAERTFGYEAAEILGRSIFTMVPPDLQPDEQQLLEQVRRGHPVCNRQTVRLRKDGSPINVSVTVSPIHDASGGVVRASSVTRDITEQTRMAAELDRTLTALKAAIDESRAAESRSRLFLCDAAHTLRNPIAGIRACAETLLRGPNAADRDQLLAQIARETAAIGRLVDRLLRIARVEQGDPLPLTRCDVAAICRDEVERARSLAPHLTMVLTGDEAVTLDAEARAVREIVGSLLENACRHSVQRIEVSLTRDAGGACFRVADDGPGLPKGAEDNAFNPFVSLDGKGGSGLGLAASKALALALGGDLRYEDRAFVLRLAAKVGAGSPGLSV